MILLFLIGGCRNDLLSQTEGSRRIFRWREKKSEVIFHGVESAEGSAEFVRDTPLTKLPGARIERQVYLGGLFALNKTYTTVGGSRREHLSFVSRVDNTSAKFWLPNRGHTFEGLFRPFWN